MRTVLATSFTPSLDSGRARRTYAVVSALARHGPLDLVYGAFGAPAPDAAYDELAGVNMHRVERPRGFQRAPAYLRARLAGVPADFARGIWPGLASRTAKLTGGGEPVRIVAEGPVAAAALLPLASRLPAIYNAHNLESSFRHRLDEAGMSLAALERFERLLLDSYHESWMVSEADLAGARSLSPAARLRFVPNVVDVAAIEPVAPRSGQQVVLFVADLGYEPNRGALKFLIEEAMPSLWRQAPEVELVIAGKGSERFAGADSRVRARGFVPDLRELYAGAGCVAVPLLEGGGSPLKFVEALAFGLPVVATPRASVGLAVEAGHDCIEAPAAAEPFAAALLEALQPSRGNALADAGRELAEREYSIEALERRLEL
ncbi:MAG TPA: glycosyltransferase family 4 protein [Solirubrobacterales bacterium]|jgi:glycosyltransferase involved in cell wall biosynthesis|nr:glycosyltransferase family 4 protein [Solirubrobacterales bacterium]